MSKPIALVVWGGLYVIAMLAAFWLVQNAPIWMAVVAAVIAVALSVPFMLVLKRTGAPRG